MSYSISSDEFQHPLLKPILEKLTTYFSDVDIRFYVIGATARDIIMEIHGEKSGRATHDLDIAIAISDWKEYKTIEEGIVNIDDFEKDTTQKQRFIFREVFELDIVPFGDIMKEDDKIFWPPDESFAMSVLGFSEVGDVTTEVNIDGNLSVNVASLAGIFILKISAWSDRHHKSNKDADDIAFVINNYLSINEERAATEYYDQIYNDDFSPIKAGAKLLGYDTAKILMESSKTKISEIISTEISKEEESILINQILETHRIFKYNETLDCLKYFISALNEKS